VVEGPQGCKQLQAWLQQWGQQVTSMDVEYDRASEEQSDKPATLPLPASQLCRLQTLQLCNFAVDLCAQPSSISTRSTRRASASRAHTLGVAVPAGAGASAFLPQLQSLELLDCWVSKSSFDQLGQLTALTSLRLSMTKVFTGASRALQPRQFEAALDSLLQQLQGLRQLTLEGGSALRHPEVALSPLSTMQHLQSLTLDGNAFNDETLRHFPTSLTRLDLVDIEPIYPAGAEFIVSPQSMPQQLSLLQELHLGRVYVHPAWLGRLTTLRKLSLGEAPIEEADDEDDDEYSDDADIRQLLGAVGRLTQLEVGVGCAAPCGACAAVSQHAPCGVQTHRIRHWHCVLGLGLHGLGFAGCMQCLCLLLSVGTLTWLWFLCRVNLDGLPDSLKLVAPCVCLMCSARLAVLLLPTACPAGIGPS
jgi:hypothetical protein